ncbi:8-oxo-dGTP diphosphatase MutT [Gorillibacterium timonense]|uniref:8-oxo-dGTP diphosphatase MutT n=1 Tax=Gorillibacterium timonense TaxID=1689269 RepID=UPI00071CC3F5|nr:8-oxo-dGTP diphosphatase MutT [Gorillibacterium timonense]
MIEVAAAIIRNDKGQLLIARRGPEKIQAGQWEFPGGKLEPGESAVRCLKRELMEEMGIEIEPFAPYGVHEHDYETFSVRLIVYEAHYVRGEIQLTDHDDYRWVDVSELGEYRFAPADIPFVDRLRGMVKGEIRSGE